MSIISLSHHLKMCSRFHRPMVTDYQHMRLKTRTLNSLQKAEVAVWIIGCRLLAFVGAFLLVPGVKNRFVIGSLRTMPHPMLANQQPGVDLEIGLTAGCIKNPQEALKRQLHIKVL